MSNKSKIAVKIVISQETIDVCVLKLLRLISVAKHRRKRKHKI